MAKRASNPANKQKSITKVANILQKSPGMASQVSTQTLQSVVGVVPGSGTIAATKALQGRAASGDYESTGTSVKKRNPKYR